MPGGLGGMGRDYPNDNITENGQNTEKSPETWGDLLWLKLQWKPSRNTDVKNSKRVNNNNNKRRKESLLIAAQNNAI